MHKCSLEICVVIYVCSTYLLLVSHGSLAAHHYLAASLLLQLFGRHATRSQNATNKVELKVELKKKHTHRK